MATPESIAEAVHLIATKTVDPFIILNTSDGLTYMQALLTPEGFTLEYQEGSVELHFETIRSDLTAQELVETFRDYMDSNPTWRHRFEFRPKPIRGDVFWSVGYRIGRWVGRAARFWRGN
ncbi:MAG: hypothetical protein U0984_04950 [Prosthecobacter sp.]|nr:hypothetical protein [Prosthecobacter sp.]